MAHLNTLKSYVFYICEQFEALQKCFSTFLVQIAVTKIDRLDTFVEVVLELHHNRP